MKRKARIGDYVKITQVPKFKGYEETISIGDIGIVNYIAVTNGKYSVHIDGKKNPVDIAHPNSRAYGNVYDFWIPPSHCEVIEPNNTEEDEWTRKCLFENADALDEPDTFNAFKIIAKRLKESEETNMKEIKNKNVVELYFNRRIQSLKDDYDKEMREVEKTDPNQIFINELQKQFNDYVKKNEEEFSLKDIRFEAILPFTLDCTVERDKLTNQLNDNIKKAQKEKEEIIAMLSGCETYDQEIAILRAYNIVSVYNEGSSIKML